MTTPMRDLRLPTSFNSRSPRSAPFSRGLAVTARLEVSIGRWHAPCVVAHVFKVGPESVVLHAIALRAIL
jgi:hypothetical protein